VTEISGAALSIVVGTVDRWPAIQTAVASFEAAASAA
jgi:hypothetical protein